MFGNFTVAPDTQKRIDDIPADEGGLKPGWYLAAVAGIEIKYKEETGTIGHQYHLAINLPTRSEERPNAVPEWDVNGRTMLWRSYQWVGRVKDGQVVPGMKSDGSVMKGEPGAFRVMKALKAQVTDPLEAQRGKLILVQLEEVPHWNDPNDTQLEASIYPLPDPALWGTTVNVKLPSVDTKPAPGTNTTAF